MPSRCWATSWTTPWTPRPSRTTAGCRSHSADDGAGIVLEVSDSGPGIPPAVRERIFDQGYSTKPADGNGRGIGLALVRSVVTGAGGSVTVSDAPTTFRVIVPAAAPRRSTP
ncbi:sensor histidine kinase [Microbacterium sp. ISL-59]|uniref:sensor histidine kinase n=1 Tax=Microbacterium sp. ISL-59 TaxID=2819159 RepID=UPI002034A9CE|nr:ATP-binding protein [Microbacterium sp. ISL-59]